MEGEDYAFAVRDLRSGQQLLWAPVRREDAAAIRRLLLELFLTHGAPLVLKSDRGSALIAEVTEDRLALWGVVHLLSPARSPCYNGAVLRPDDFAHVFEVANEVGGQEGRSTVSSSAVWQERRTMGDEVRRAFAQAVAATERDAQVARSGSPAARARSRRYDVMP